MKQDTQNERIRISTQGYDRWKAEVLLSNGETSEEITRKHLRDIKAELSKQTGIPEDHFQYTRLLDRKETPEGLILEMEIVKQEICKGAPVFRLESLAGPDGTLFTDMELKIDLFPYDEFDKPLIRETLENRLVMAGIQLDLLDWIALKKALETLKKTNKELINLAAGRGILPGFGTNAIIEYALPVSERNRALPAQVGTRRTKKGEVLLYRTPATVGLKVGRNLWGRELAPRRGRDVELKVGEGAKLSSDARCITAERDGLAIFEHLEQTIRHSGKVERFPARIVVDVEPLHTIEGNRVLELKYEGHLEIEGNLLSGSQLQVTGAVIIHGDIEKDSKVIARGNIHINGKIKGGFIQSDGFLGSNEGATEVEAKAEKGVYIHGKVEDSYIAGQDVHLREVKRSKIHALREVVVERIDDSSESESEIVVNMREFLARRQGENVHTFQNMTETLKRLVQLFGSDIIQSVDSTNIRQVLHKFLRDQKGKGVPTFSHNEIVNLRRMLELVPDFRNVLTDLGQELREVTEQIQSHPDEEILLVREPIGSLKDVE